MSGSRPNYWAVAIGASTVLHGVLAAVAPLPPDPPAVRDWHDSVMIEIPEPPPLEEIPLIVEPPPEPAPPAPAPEVIQADELPAVDPPDNAPPPSPDTPPDAAPPVQGLSASSFAEGANTGLTVRAGTTLRAAATTTSLAKPVERPAAVGWSDVPKRPRCRTPAIVVPPAVIEQGLEGEVYVRVDIGADGAVTEVRVSRGLSPEADASCVAAWSSVTCKPAQRGKEPIAVINMPHSCVYKAVR
ncbi:MAG: energy transducer TonB [Myxococcota bacterium]